VTVFAVLIDTAHVGAVPLQTPPDQPLKTTRSAFQVAVKVTVEPLANARVHPAVDPVLQTSWVPSAPATSLVTVPATVPTALTVTGYVTGMNAARTSLSEFIVKEQIWAVPAQTFPQPWNSMVEECPSVRTTAARAATVPVQPAAVQLSSTGTPSAVAVTEPVPVPAYEMVRACVAGPNVATTFRAEDMMTSQVFPDVELHPDQLPKPSDGLAVSRIVAPRASSDSQPAAAPAVH
jgi:hypothetical protein